MNKIREYEKVRKLSVNKNREILSVKTNPHVPQNNSPVF